jgi:hypothetical protein
LASLGVIYSENQEARASPTVLVNMKRQFGMEARVMATPQGVKGSEGK